MFVQRSTRAAFVIVMGMAGIAASGAPRAQSLTDALSGPAARAARIGTWATEVVPDADSWRPTIIVAKSRPSTKTGLRTASIVAKESAYALNGPEPAAAPKALRGLASYYGRGELTAAGERFDPNAMTAAHRTLPFGTRVRVTRVDNGDSVVVRINDRGPFKPDRVIDLSERAAENLGMTGVGLADVRLEVLGQ
jgi:rare lipoprotein A